MDADVISLSRFRKRISENGSSKGNAEVIAFPSFGKKCMLKKHMLVFNDSGYAFKVPEEICVYFTAVENESGVQYIVYTFSPKCCGVSDSEEMALYRYLVVRFG